MDFDLDNFVKSQFDLMSEFCIRSNSTWKVIFERFLDQFPSAGYFKELLGI